MKKKLAFFLISIFCVGCDYQSTQYIEGFLLRDGQPVAGIDVELVSGDDYEKCGSTQISTVSDQEGKFIFERSIQKSRIHNYVHLDSLCLYSNGKWIIVWKSTHAPAPNRMNFECNKVSDDDWQCVMNGLKSD